MTDRLGLAWAGAPNPDTQRDLYAEFEDKATAACYRRIGGEVPDALEQRVRAAEARARAKSSKAPTSAP